MLQPPIAQLLLLLHVLCLHVVWDRLRLSWRLLCHVVQYTLCLLSRCLLLCPG